MRFGFSPHFPDDASLAQIPKLYGDTVRLTGGGKFEASLPLLRERGIGVVFVASFANYDIAAWKAAWARWAMRWKADPQMVAFELGNEPNVFGNFTPQVAADYVRAGYKACREAGWTKPLLAPGPGGRYDNRLPYLREMFAAGIPNAAELGLHPYPDRRRPDEYPLSVAEQIKAARKILRNRSGHRRIWVTEVGVSTEEWSEAEQAERLVKIVRRCRRLNVKATVVWQFADSGPDWVGQLGVLHRDYSAKQSYGALKEA